jgi:hypothetical protein
MTLNVDMFDGYSAALDQLPDHCRDATSELIWSYRMGELSLCWVTEDVAAYTEVLGGTVPEILTISGSGRYFVDLESLGTSKIRLHIESPNEGEVLIGYYFDSLATDASPYEYKIYTRASKTGVCINRFDGAGVVISQDEGEVETEDQADWKGPDSLLQTCLINAGQLRILKKTLKDQSYLRMIGFL